MKEECRLFQQPIPIFNDSLWVCGAMKQVKLLLFVPFSPKPLFCSIAPQTPVVIALNMCPLLT
jgi:hypothetical protein